MEIGDKNELEYVITDADSARSLSIEAGDDFPSVFATSRMIALMELAAARLMKSLLAEGELSVGVTVNVKHLAATPIGTNVKAVAEYIGLNGKTYSFKVYLYDKGGLAGSGEHTRAIVNSDRLLEGANRRGLT
ncbi:MAG: thioesterase [Pseudomonadales bacterium]|jgi:fluoroacetyl-CoA thioesterase|nr:thioesterase [Pseudomonadales bacterium]MEC8813768.1 thioesterase family protein [Pseudomonadota bacterium]|tara:strand:- start:820 stop:1218 length:399 start_codon:yes stop_codon:yes gene_type:complete